MTFPRLHIRMLLVLVFVSSIFFALIAAKRKAEAEYMWIGAQPIPMSGFEPSPKAQSSVP